MSSIAGKAYVVGTWDTKGAELDFIAKTIEEAGVGVRRVDVGTSGNSPWSVDHDARRVASAHPEGAGAVLGLGDRGRSIAAMSEALVPFLSGCEDIAGVIGAGGTGNTALLAPALRALPIGLPKILISTVAGGDVSAYVGPSDLTMMPSVTDVQGLNRISRRILSNGANALAGMIQHEVSAAAEVSAAIPVGMTMFGVTTPCIQQITRLLGDGYDCLVFHATGIGGQVLEKLVDSGLISSVIDITTTEVADLLCGGVFAATPDRFGAIERTGVPYVGSCGALDMINFRSADTVTGRYRDRLLHMHNPQITLMRTTPHECVEIGTWIAGRLNRCPGPVRFLLPLGGVSALDSPGQPFWDAGADRALFEAIEACFEQNGNHRLIKVDAHINDPGFAATAAEQFRSIN